MTFYLFVITELFDVLSCMSVLSNVLSVSHLMFNLVMGKLFDVI